MARTILPASVENRLKGQADVWRRMALHRESEKSSRRTAPFITISRQYGCSAFDLGQALAQRLRSLYPHWEYTVYDRRILEVLAERENISADMVASMSEGSRSVVTHWVDDLIGAKPADVTVFRRLASTMCSIAALGASILVGRGGSVITRGIPGGLHIRLIAPLAWRVARLQQTDHEAEATPSFVEQADRGREQFVERFLHADANDPQLYHLTLNNQRLSLEEQAEAVTALVQQRVNGGIVHVS
ncbi:MAG: cytidylate kinase-like family protein [Gemmatimonadetes bacterium]|jgi:cytidylate kinase|nr:cytidylate kinase-like family protein [Gemmatimonadota bacterium]MBT6149954.1 cytidylate kinase-like family protein [Gemmatimonadota bacterium]MBT7860819.1 cytidylate kinase-like family protein [Gemmatimonadota bacterium]